MKKPDGKVVLLGDMNVGKTSLLHRYMERRFQETVSTVGGAFYLKQWGPYNISIWDTAGEAPGTTRPLSLAQCRAAWRGSASGPAGSRRFPAGGGVFKKLAGYLPAAPLLWVLTPPPSRAETVRLHHRCCGCYECGYFFSSGFGSVIIV